MRQFFKGFRSLGVDDPEIVACAFAMGAERPAEDYFGEETCQASEDAFGHDGLGLQQLLFACAANAGMTVHGGDRVNQNNLREILEYCFAPPAALAQMSGVSTITLPGVLGAIANKEMRQGFKDFGEEFREIATLKQRGNFYEHTHASLLSNMEYEEVGPAGEIPSTSLQEETFTSRLKTYAKMTTLDRADIINDDASALDRIYDIMGNGGAQAFSHTFWSTFMANSTFFTTARGNYLAGATTNLGVDGVGLGLALTAFRKMRSADGGRIDGRAAKIVVPPEIEFNARRLFVGTGVNLGGSSSAETIPGANVYAGQCRPVIVDYLSDSTFTGNSTKAYYIFRNGLRPVLVTHLRDVFEPQVEGVDADFNRLGIQIRGVFDYGVTLSEYCAGLKVKGEV